MLRLGAKLKVVTVGKGQAIYIPKFYYRDFFQNVREFEICLDTESNTYVLVPVKEVKEHGVSHTHSC